MGKADAAIEEVLKRMGWTSGFHLPVANDANKALQHRVEELMVQKAKGTIAFENAQSRCDSMNKHLKFVKQQNEENQQLIAAYKRQMDMEDHKYRMTKAERDSYQQEIRTMEKEIEDVDERNTRQKLNVSRGIERVEKLKCEATWDTEALNAWEDSLKKRDEDNETLKKYSKEDEKKAKDFEIRRQNLSLELVDRRERISKMVAEIQNYEQILERITKELNQQNDEKCAMLKQWHEAVANLNRLNKAIVRMNKDIIQAQDELNQEREKYDQQDDFYNNQISDNKELAEKIATSNAYGSRIKKQLLDLTQDVLTLRSEANTVRRRIGATANFLEKERATKKHILNEMERKKAQIIALRKELIQIEDELVHVKQKSMNAAERTTQMEQIIENEKRLTMMLDQDCQRMAGTIFRTQEQYKKLKDQMKMKEVEISGCESSINSLRKVAQINYNEVAKQKEIIYNTEYKLNCLEQKMAMLEGETTDDNKQFLEEKAHELDLLLVEQNDIKSMIQGQITRMEDEMRRLQVTMLADSTQLATLKDKLQSELVILDVGSKQAAIMKQAAQQKQVDENILQLRVDQMEQMTKREQDSIFNLQKYRLELETAMKERQLELGVKRDILMVRRRNLDEEKGRLKADIMNRRTRIHQLQQKYHIAVMALGKDEDGNPLSVTHFKIKNAQEKYMLQEEGDKIDAQVRRTEKEIIAMENTLKVVNQANVEYRHNLASVDNSDEVVQMEELQHTVNQLKAEQRSRLKELSNKQQRLEQLKDDYIKLEKENSEYRQQLECVQGDYMRMQQLIDEQRIKMERADRHLSTVHTKLSMKNIEKYRNNLLIRHLQEANKGALQQLNQLPERHEEMAEKVIAYVSEHNLALPKSKSSLASSSSGRLSLGSSSCSLNLPSVSQITLTFDPIAQIGSRRLSTGSTRCNPKAKF